jgi:hypothetical protein
MLTEAVAGHEVAADVAASWDDRFAIAEAALVR